MSDLASLLHFYSETGADWVLDDVPIDRFAEARHFKQRQEQKRNAVQSLSGNPSGTDRVAKDSNVASDPTRGPAAAIPQEAQVELARSQAKSAKDLDELSKLFSSFDGCNLKFTAKSFVFSDGNPQAHLMVIGEAPGRDEDLQGLPFVGRSGQLLDRMLAAIGLDRSGVYITNIIPWRPPGNRTPTPFETEICRPFLERHIELVSPQIILALGRPSMAMLTGKNESILRSRGSWMSHMTPAGVEIPVLPTLHPAYLLRNPAHKSFAWRDFLSLKMKLRELENGQTQVTDP